MPVLYGILKSDINKIEMVQLRAARYVTNRQHNTSSVGDMLQQLKWCSLEDRRRDARLVMMHKISHDKVAVSKSDRLSPPLRHSRNMHSRSYQVPLCRTQQRKASFSLEPLLTGTAYLRQQYWVTLSSHSGLPLPHLILKFTSCFVHIFLAYLLIVLFPPFLLPFSHRNSMT